jgi:tRNA G10  N-methylase Trm11
MTELALVLVAILAVAYAGHWIATSDHPAIEFARVMTRIVISLVCLAANIARFTVNFVRAEVRQW